MLDESTHNLPRRLSLAITAAYSNGVRNIGELHIYPRANATAHPVSGAFFTDTGTIPFMGTISGLRVVSEPQARRGRPPSEARDMAVYLARESFFCSARRDLGDKKATEFANRQLLDFWDKWFQGEPDVEQTKRALRRARENARKRLGYQQKAVLRYTGHADDFSDYVALLLLPGTVACCADGELRVSGQGWVWRWGMQEAQFHAHLDVTARTPKAPEFEYVIPGQKMP